MRRSLHMGELQSVVHAQEASELTCSWWAHRYDMPWRRMPMVKLKYRRANVWRQYEVTVSLVLPD